MLKDKATEKTYSSGVDARRQLGELAFNKKVRMGEIEYIRTQYI